jgi:hypothetical protein
LEASPSDDKQEEPAKTDKHIEYQQADVDVSEFRPATLRFLEALGLLLGSKSLPEALLVLKDPHSPLTDDSEAELVLSDILDKRNEHLIAQIEKALSTYDTIVVPWGAMHLPAIELQLQEWGFKETKRVRRKAVDFQKRLGASPASAGKIAQRDR